MRTALALLVSLDLAGAAVVVVAARTTTSQVEGLLRTVVDSAPFGPSTGNGERVCEIAAVQPALRVPGLTEVVVEVRGPAGQVCRRPGAPGLDPLRAAPAMLAWASGTDLPYVDPPGGAPVLVLEVPVGEGWTARFGGDLGALTELARRLLTTMVAVSVLGALLAAAAGTGVARNALRPVRELADAAEGIARTQDLSVRIDVPDRFAGDEIGRLAGAFNRMTAALSQARERQAALVADAGHELRTPLTSLRANLELLERSERTGRALPPAHRAGLLADLGAQFTELSHLVDELVVLGRDGSARPRGPVRLDAVTRLAVERVRVRAGAGRPWDVELEPWTVPAGDAEGLERAIVNLLDNAVKFSPPATPVRVRLAGGELTVDDEGPGIAPADRVRAFERFWRADDARALPGSGLGLAIVADTVAAHEGRVRLTGAAGGGTRAVMALPGEVTTPVEGRGTGPGRSPRA